ncbi:hypothetical protein M0804_013240 [Polistes exclamans]|nr:hypothetical protein M0804_013240 [Polistes exclamans]
MCELNVITNCIVQETCLLECFDPESMDVLKWINSFEYLINVCRIENDKKAEYLLNYLSPIVLQILKSKVHPVNLCKLSYNELISKLEIYFSCYTGVWAANYRFLYRDQYLGEKIPEYVLALRKIASNGSYFLRDNRSLKIRFIKGLIDENTKLLLLEEKDLTFAKAVTIAQQMELYKISTLMN